MSTATQRHKARVAALVDSPMDGDEIMGAQSDDVNKYLPLAAGLLSEVTAQELKKKEDKEAKAKLEASDGFKAQKAAADARQRAELAKADAYGEVDPNGPKHKMAADYERAAQVAEQRARVYAATSTSNVLSPGGAMVPMGGQPSMFTPKNMMIGAGVLLGLGAVVYLARRR